MKFPRRAEVPITDWASRKMRSSYLLSWSSSWCHQNVAENFSKGSTQDQYMEHLSPSQEVIASMARQAAAVLHIKMLIFIDLLWFTAQNIIFWGYFSVHSGQKWWRSMHGPMFLQLEVADCSKALEREHFQPFQPGSWSIVSAPQEANRRQRNKTFKFICPLKK